MVLLFLNLSKDEREWIKRVHHRMGPPGIQRNLRLFSKTHMQISGSSPEHWNTSVTLVARPKVATLWRNQAAIHAHLGFNDVVGMDTASWTNDNGDKFVFVHFLDEGTSFSIWEKRCAEDSKSQLQCFEETWLSWAGPPKQLYLDPASEYTSDKWIEAMQSEDISTKDVSS